MPFSPDFVQASKEIVVAAIAKGYPKLSGIEAKDQNQQFVDGIKVLISEVYQSLVTSTSQE